MTIKMKLKKWTFTVSNVNMNHRANIWLHATLCVSKSIPLHSTPLQINVLCLSFFEAAGLENNNYLLLCWLKK